MILFPYSHTNVAGPDFHKHLQAGKKLAEGIKEINNNHYSSGAVGIILCKPASYYCDDEKGSYVCVTD